MDNNFFMSLGGGDEIGASSYFVSCGEKNFLFDMGIRYVKKRRYPSFSELLKIPNIDTLNDLDGIFLSHAHYDHNGALPLLVSKILRRKEIICTDYTKEFTKVQFEVLKGYQNNKYIFCEKVMAERAIDMLVEYPIGKKIEKNGYSFTLYKAGHIPGAIMVLLEVNDKKILYTGDFSDKNYPLAGKYELPIISDLDLLIVNSTNAFKKDDNWENTWGSKSTTINDILKEIILYKEINVEVAHVNCGMETALLLNDTLENTSFSHLGINIYVDEKINSMLQVLRKKENKEYKYIKLIPSSIVTTNNIFITVHGNEALNRIKKLNIYYSLHETYKGIKDLILKLNPKKTLITHYEASDKKEDILIKDLEKKGYFNCEYVINNEIYDF